MSYRITIDGEPFCSSNFDHSQILDPKVTLEANKAGSLTFTMLPDHPYYDGIAFRQSLFDVYLNDELIFEGIPVDEATDFYNRKTITCEGELTFLNDTIQRQAVYQNKTVAGLLGEYLTVHNAQADASKQFSLGSVTVDGGNSLYRYTNYESTMKELQEDLIENFGGFFRVRHSGGTRYLDYLDASPHNSSQTIRIGKNLVDLSQNLSSLDICTVLIPLGAKTEEQLIEGLEARLTIASVNSGLDYLVGTAQAYYGNVWKTKVWDDVTTASALKSKGQDYLDDAQWANLVIQATAFDLGLATDDVEQFRVLDMIRVISEPHGLDRYFLLSKLNIDLDHPANTQITLGQDTRLTLSARTAQVSAEVERQPTQIMVNASNNARQILDSATDGAIQILYNSDGVAYELRINNSQNPATATKWWRYNSGGWGYTADGGQTYTVAATMDGAILASLITTGILKSDDGTTFYLDLDNGVLKGNFSELKISGAAGATQSYANSAASSAVSTYDGNLNQQAVFNKLTNNQANQGIYLQNGNLFINASMIAAGILSGREINNGNGTFKVTSAGALTATSGAIANWAIDPTRLYKTTSITPHSFTNIDAARMGAVINGTVSEESVLAQYPWYDLDGDGHITTFDVRLVGAMIRGYIPNGTISSATAQLNSDRPYGSLTSLSSVGQGFVGGAFGVFGTSILGNVVFLQDTSGRMAVLDPTGLSFYDSSGNLTKSYPAT